MLNYTILILVTSIRECPCPLGIFFKPCFREVRDDNYIDVRFAVCGNVDSGKSTMIGVLTRGKLDNGRGLVRVNVFQHKHELESGRTSSISQQIMGFNAKGIFTHLLFSITGYVLLVQKI